MTKQPILFFSRCKPKGIDALEIALKHNIIFFGYALTNVNLDYDPTNLRNFVVDLGINSDKEWEAAYAATGRKKHNSYAFNRNLVKDVVPGSIAMIPRPDKGVVYAGRVVGEFELANNPPWLNEFYQLLKSKNGQFLLADGSRFNQPENDNGEDALATEVAQIWRVDKFKSIPLTDIPGWIRPSLFGRSTCARVNPYVYREDNKKNQAFEVLDALIDGQRSKTLHWTIEPSIVADRIERYISPSYFEHLVVSLLQLEEQDKQWTQVGGSGDGGVDGICYNDSGNLDAILQCKMLYGKTEPEIANANEYLLENTRKYFAAYFHPPFNNKSDIHVIDKNRIIELLIKHRNQLPDAITLRIGAKP